MSAEPQRSTTTRAQLDSGSIVFPQAVTDPTILDSVAGFINDVVPAAYNGGGGRASDHKDQIQWARFEQLLDTEEEAAGSFCEESVDCERLLPGPLILVLGYVSGIQLWSVPANGEAQCLLSWRHGNVRCLRLLPSPRLNHHHHNHQQQQPPYHRHHVTEDSYANKRPLMALCDSIATGSVHHHHQQQQQYMTSGGAPTSQHGGSTGGQHHSVSFVSLRTGDPVKRIKFQSAVLDIVANRRSIAITFPERIAVFDAATLEDRLTVTTCYPSPGLYGNPITLGSRWMAYAENRLILSCRSSGGNESEGVQSYTATVLHAAKSIGRGLRELGETVASSLTGTGGGGGGNGRPSSTGGGGGGYHGNYMGGGGQDLPPPQKGVVTVLDIESESIDGGVIETESIIAHFVAHTEAIVCMSFDPSGMLLLTADKRGHDFHLFRIHPHPAGAPLAAVHHLYILHRGDTSARVQDMSFSADSRWTTVSTLRGTTHCFPVTPYGGVVAVRTHGTPHVVNQMSRFHRSAGLTAEGRSCSPATASTATILTAGGGGGIAVPVATVAGGGEGSPLPYYNPRRAPFPQPTVVAPLAQIRQPLYLQQGVGGVVGGGGGGLLDGGRVSHSGRQRLGSSSDDNVHVALRVSACFAPARAWPDTVLHHHHRGDVSSTSTVSGQQSSSSAVSSSGTLGGGVGTTTTGKSLGRSVESLFVMSCHGSLVQYDLEPHHTSGVPREKVCDDTPIELSVCARAQWILQRQPNGSMPDLQLPLSSDVLEQLLCQEAYRSGGGGGQLRPADHHSNNSGNSTTDDRWLSQVEIVTHAGPHRRLWMGPQFTFKTYQNGTGTAMNIMDSQPLDVGRSKPVNMPRSTAPHPVLIEAGSVSSCEPSPQLLDGGRSQLLSGNKTTMTRYGEENQDDGGGGGGEVQLREDLADAMMESGGVGMVREDRDTGGRCVVIVSLKQHQSSQQSKQQQQQSRQKQSVVVTKVVNPLGTVVTIPPTPSSLDNQHNNSDNRAAAAIGGDGNDDVIHANCDERLFRPVVAAAASSNALVYTEPVCLQTKDKPVNLIHVDTNVRRKDTNVSKKQKNPVDTDSLDKKSSLLVENVSGDSVEVKTTTKTVKTKGKKSKITNTETNDSVSKNLGNFKSKNIENQDLASSKQKVYEFTDVLVATATSSGSDDQLTASDGFPGGLEWENSYKQASSVREEELEGSAIVSQAIIVESPLKSLKQSQKTIVERRETLEAEFDGEIEDERMQSILGNVGEVEKDKDAFRKPYDIRCQGWSNKGIVEDIVKSKRDIVVTNKSIFEANRDIVESKEDIVQAKNKDKEDISIVNDTTTVKTVVIGNGKKPRKPRAKLGVRITPNSTKESVFKSNSNSELEIELDLPESVEKLEEKIENLKGTFRDSKETIFKAKNTFVGPEITPVESTTCNDAWGINTTSKQRDKDSNSDWTNDLHSWSNVRTTASENDKIGSNSVTSWSSILKQQPSSSSSSNRGSCERENDNTATKTMTDYEEINTKSVTIDSYSVTTDDVVSQVSQTVTDDDFDAKDKDSDDKLSSDEDKSVNVTTKCHSNSDTVNNDSGNNESSSGSNNTALVDSDESSPTNTNPENEEEEDDHQKVEIVTSGSSGGAISGQSKSSKRKSKKKRK